MRPSRTTALSATCTRWPWWAWTGRSTSSAARLRLAVGVRGAARRRARRPLPARAAARRTRRASSSTCPTPTSSSPASCRATAWPRSPTSCRSADAGQAHKRSCGGPRRCAARSASACAARRASTTRAPAHGERRSDGQSSSSPRRRRPLGPPAAHDACRCRSRTATRSAEFTLAPDESAVFVLEDACTTSVARAAATADYVATAFKETVELLARLGRPLDLPGPLARDGEPLGADAEAAHLADRTARSSPRRPSASPSRSAARATGTTATPGSATPRSPSTRFMRLGYTDEAGAFMRWVEARCESSSPTARCRSCTASTGATSCPRRRCRTSRATVGSTPVRIGNAASTNSSSTSTAS